MRLKPGRPDLTRYAAHFAVPAAAPDSPVRVRWAGVSTLLFEDGDSAVLTDGFFSRPSLAQVAARRIAPSAPRVHGCLARLGVQRLDAVVPVHSHYDHILDSALVAERTGAALVGGQSTAQVGRGHGLAPERSTIATPGTPVRAGAFELTLFASTHCPPDRFPGAITAPVTPPVRVSAYRCGEAWAMLLRHLPSGHRALVQGSAGYRPGLLDGQRAEVAYLGLGQIGVLSPRYLTEYWTHTVRAVGARAVVGIHWDDFFRPLSKPLRALPYAVDDLDVTLRTLGALAHADGVSLQLPTLWRCEDPWR